jgi:TnpA family transposase
MLCDGFSVKSSFAARKADARVYGVPVRALNATYHPRYFASAGRGVAIYTHVSDLWIPFYTQVITCHARQASFVLDGLLYHGTRLEPKEHYTDTHGVDLCRLPSTRHPLCATYQGPAGAAIVAAA